MYWDEGVHARPHFHARYAEDAASIDFAGRADRGLAAQARARARGRMGSPPPRRAHRQLGTGPERRTHSSRSTHCPNMNRDGATRRYHRGRGDRPRTRLQLTFARRDSRRGRLHRPRMARRLRASPRSRLLRAGSKSTMKPERSPGPTVLTLHPSRFTTKHGATESRQRRPEPPQRPGHAQA